MQFIALDEYFAVVYHYMVGISLRECPDVPGFRRFLFYHSSPASLPGACDNCQGNRYILRICTPSERSCTHPFLRKSTFGTCVFVTSNSPIASPHPARDLVSLLSWLLCFCAPPILVAPPSSSYRHVYPSQTREVGVLPFCRTVPSPAGSR